MTDDFQLKPIEPVTFDASLYQWLLDEEARIHALHGPRLTRLSGCEPLLRWLMRQYPEADPRSTPVTLLAIPLTIDDDVPLDSLRLTYVDGTHKDVRVIEPPDPADFRIEMPMTGFGGDARRFLSDGGRPLLYDPHNAMGDPHGHAE